MPIYEYHCKNCGNEFEKIMGFSDPRVNSPDRPNCQSDNTQKRLSTIAAYSGGKRSSSTASSCGSSGGFS
jgi:putative FmdB family regulatory protein